jgi:hypothetical protein
MQTGSSVTLIGWKSGQTPFVPLWDRMEGAWLRTQMNFLHNQAMGSMLYTQKKLTRIFVGHLSSIADVNCTNVGRNLFNMEGPFTDV